MTDRSNDFPIYLINLDGSDDRLDKARAALSRQDADFTRISAYDGRKLDPHDLPEYDSAATRRYMGRDLNGGEIGCFYSHIWAAEEFLKTGAEFGLVLEDDMSPAPDAIEATRALIAWQKARGKPDWFMAHLGDPRMKILTQVGTIGSGQHPRTIYRAHYFPMTTTALLWTRDGAEAFLQLAFPLTCPVDNFMRRWLTETDKGIALQPPVFSTTGAGSEIDKSHRRKRRGLDNRSWLYGWRKQKRMQGDKLRAALHKRKWTRVDE